MKIPFLGKLIEATKRKQKKEDLILLRKRLSEERIKAKREAKIKVFVENGERAATLIREKGISNLSLGKLKVLQKAMILELANFDKEVSIKFGGHWANVHDLSLLVRNRIEELEKLKKRKDMWGF